MTRSSLRCARTCSTAWSTNALADPNASAETLRATCEELLAAGRDQERLIEALLTLAGSERGLELRERTDIGALTTPIVERPRPELVPDRGAKSRPGR